MVAHAMTISAHESHPDTLTEPAVFSVRKAVTSTGIAVNPNSLLYHVRDLVFDRIAPLTRKFHEQGLTFKKQMVHPEVQNVCRTYEKKLKRVFQQYAQRNRNANFKGKLLDLNDFEMLLKDKHLIDALFPHGKLKQIFTFVQQDPDSSHFGGTEGEAELMYGEFLEALAAIAVYRNANPYLPFAKKLETFLEETF
jgi:hypothetical protein